MDSVARRLSTVGTGAALELRGVTRLFGALAAWQTGNWWWLLGAVVLVANWPFTIFAIMPTNNKLMAMDAGTVTSEVRKLIETWGYLHAVRSALGAVATLIFLAASLSK